MITYEDFQKLDLRIGRVLEVNEHPQAERLYLLKVDIGEKTIQLVAGIRPFYQPQDLKDKLVVVLVNLEPRKIRGYISEGMVLAASGERVSILSVLEPVAVGSKIR